MTAALQNGRQLKMYWSRPRIWMPAAGNRDGCLQHYGHCQPLDMAVQAIPQTNEQTFLMDILKQPNSGNAQRYKRLGISVRQGQKLKDRLCRDGIIAESEAITANIGNGLQDIILLGPIEKRLYGCQIMVQTRRSIKSL